MQTTNEDDAFSAPDGEDVSASAALVSPVAVHSIVRIAPMVVSEDPAVTAADDAFLQRSVLVLAGSMFLNFGMFSPTQKSVQ